jgi:hypothetical protein
VGRLGTPTQGGSYARLFVAAVAVIVACTAGCTHPITPQGVMEQNPGADYTRALDARSAAACMASNINNRDVSAQLLVASAEPGQGAVPFQNSRAHWRYCDNDGC